MMNNVHVLKAMLNEHGFVNLFSVAFSTLLYIRINKGYFIKLLMLTSYSSLVADCMFVLTDGPDNVVLTNLKAISIMTFFEVILWSVRDIGLTLYTNKLIKILDTTRSRKLYYTVYNMMFVALCLWRLVDSGLRTYDHYALYIEGKVERMGDVVYLSMLSALEIWSSIFLLYLLFLELKRLNTDLNIYKIMKKMIYSGVLRVLFINMIPMLRVIINETVASDFDYNNDVVYIIFELQASMCLMYLIDMAIMKLEANNIFKSNQPNSVQNIDNNI
jgi:hypothetical protein